MEKNQNGNQNLPKAPKGIGINGEKTAVQIEVSKSAKQPVPAVPAMPSIEELQAKAEKTAQMVQRYQSIKAKKAELDSFVILYETEQAKIVITDVKGRSITTNNPKSIESVIQIWKADICEALAKAEQDIRGIMNAHTTPEMQQQAA
jgi:predicted transcriptional regulator